MKNKTALSKSQRWPVRGGLTTFTTTILLLDVGTQTDVLVRRRDFRPVKIVVQHLTTRSNSRQYRRTDRYDRFAFFAQLTLLPNPKIRCFAMLVHRPDTPEVSVFVGDIQPHITHVPWTHLTPHSKLHVDWFSRFPTDNGRVSL